MPTVIAYHEIDDRDHWLASPKREEFFGPLGISIRTFLPTTSSAAYPNRRTAAGLNTLIAPVRSMMIMPSTVVSITAANSRVRLFQRKR